MGKINVHLTYEGRRHVTLARVDPADLARAVERLKEGLVRALFHSLVPASLGQLESEGYHVLVPRPGASDALAEELLPVRAGKIRLRDRELARLAEVMDLWKPTLLADALPLGVLPACPLIAVSEREKNTLWLAHFDRLPARSTGWYAWDYDTFDEATDEIFGAALGPQTFDVLLTAAREMQAGNLSRLRAARRRAATVRR